MIPLRCCFDVGRLTFESAAPTRVQLAGVVPQVRMRRGTQRFVWSPTALEQRGDVYEAVHAEAALRLRLLPRVDQLAWVLQLEVENVGTSRVHIEDLAPLSIDASHAAAGQVVVGTGYDRWSVFRNGYQSWSGTRTYRVDEADLDPRWGFLRVSHVDIRHPSSGRPGHFRSEGFMTIKNLRSGEALCLGFLDLRRAFAGVEIDVATDVFNSVHARVDFDDVTLAPGESVASGPLWIAAGRDEHELLESYAAAAGGVMQARIGARNLRGWCSWYYYFQHVSEAAVLKNLASLAASRDQCPCDYVMIDDGYELAIGDWLSSNQKFPHGMPWLAEQIRSAGFDAGIWLAPFIARPESRLFAEHDDWFVRTADGSKRTALWNPVWGWRGYAYALDTTHPAVTEWLERLAHTVVHEWGFGILKLDFLFAPALPGERHDRQATRAEALRRGLEAIRAGAGDDAFLLGCGCPLGPAVGIVDGMRIGPDVAPFWTNRLSRGPLRDRHGVATKNAIRNTLARAFLHRRWWINDPDCLMVRSANTRLTSAEVRSLAAVIAVTDGMFVLSDRVDKLTRERLGLLARAAALAGGVPRVVDLFEQDLPELVVSRRPHETLLGVFNFDDQPVRKTVDVAAFGLMRGEVEDLWSGAQWPVQDGWLDLGEMPPHASAVLRIGRDGEAEEGAGS